MSQGIKFLWTKVTSAFLIKIYFRMVFSSHVLHYLKGNPVCFGQPSGPTGLNSDNWAKQTESHWRTSNGLEFSGCSQKHSIQVISGSGPTSGGFSSTNKVNRLLVRAEMAESNRKTLSMLEVFWRSQVGWRFILASNSFIASLMKTVQPWVMSIFGCAHTFFAASEHGKPVKSG